MTAPNLCVLIQHVVLHLMVHNIACEICGQAINMCTQHEDVNKVSCKVKLLGRSLALSIQPNSAVA